VVAGILNAASTVDVVLESAKDEEPAFRLAAS
jgi:hypothetical protein